MVNIALFPLDPITFSFKLSLLSTRLRRYELSDDLVIVDLIHFYFVEGTKHLDCFIEYLVFNNCSHCWGVMLLEAHNHVTD